jgi:hypothetical protein
MKKLKRILGLGFATFSACLAVTFGQTFTPTNTLTVTGATNVYDLAVGNLISASANKEIVLTNATNYNTVVANNFLPLISLSGTLLSQTNISYNGYNSRAIAVGDFNSDGYMDITHSSECNCSNAYIQAGSAAGTFSPATISSAFFMQRFTSDIAVGSMLNNGRTSIASGGNALTEIKTNTGVGTSFSFTNAGNSLLNTNNPANSSWGFQVADMNGDGLGDVVAAYPTAGSVYIFYNTGASPYFNTTNVQVINMTGNGVSDNVNGLGIGDIDGDGDIDVSAMVRTNTSGGRVVYVITNNGGGSFSVSSPVTVASYSTWLEMADMNGDGRADIVVPGGGQIKVYNSNNGAFTSVASYSYNFGASRVALEDINMDGATDIAAISSTQILVLLNGSISAVNSTQSSLSGFSSCLGVNSSNLTTIVSGVGLSNNIVITAPTGFEISTNASTGFGATLTLNQVSGSVAATTIYVRMTGATAGAISGNLTLTSGATSNTVALSGTVNNAPVVNAGQDQTAFAGTQVTLSGSGATSYTWNNGVSNGVPFTVNATTTYTVTGNTSGCTGTDQVVVTVLAAPTLSINTNDSICAGQTTTLSVSAAATGTPCASTGLPASLQNGLVGYWPFCGNANDASGNGNNGTVNGATLTTDRFGAANKAYSFDGTNYIEVNPNNSFNNNLMSVSCWINRTDFTDNDAFIGLRTDVNNSRFSCHAANNNTGLGVWDGSNFLTTSNNLLNNNWYHVVFVFQASNCLVYVNGNLVGTINSVIGNGSSNPLFFGQADNSGQYNNERWQGMLDDIGIWNRTLTQQEITQLYQQGQPSYSWSTGATTSSITVTPTQTTNYTCTTTLDGASITQSQTITVSPYVSWANIQFPANSTIACGGNVNVYGQVYEGSLTPAAGANNAISVQVGVHTANTDPSTWPAGAWSNATWNTQSGNNDEYVANIGGALAQGTYYYSFRYAVNGSSCYVYGGYNGGFWNGTTNVNGVLTIDGLDWANLQFPASGAVCQGQSFNAYGQVFESGVTNAAGATAGMIAEIGVATTNTDPSTWPANAWSAASFNSQSGNNDEFIGTISGLSAGTYYYAFRYKLATACSYQYGGYSGAGGGFWGGANGNGTLTVNALPTVSAGSNQAVCTGASVTLSGSGASSYTWNNSVQNGVAFTPNSTTTYTVTGTSANGCTNTAQTTVTVNALPTVTAPANQTVCSGTNVTLSGGGASTYAWNNGVSNGVAFPANATTTYTVTGTAANGCTNTAQTTVTVNASPTVTATASQSVCSGTSVTLSGSGATSYTWNNSVQDGVAFTPNATTTYTVTGTAANGCTNTAQTTVTVNALPTVTASANQTVCSGSNVTLNGGGASTYAWNNGVSNGVAFPANATTTYTVTGTDANGCTNTAQTTVTVNALPTVTAPANQTVCSGTNVTLTGGGASTYAWNNGVSNGVAFPANATTTYTVTGTAANGCTNTAQTTVTVNALPTVTAPANQTVCSGTNVTLTGGGASTYAWNNGVSNGVAFPANATTTYTVTGTDANGCTNTAQTTVTVNALPTVTATANQTVCSGTNVTLSGGGASTYAWNNGITNGVAFPANATTTYTVTGTAANGCTNTAQTTVTVNALPTVTASANQTVCSGTNVTLSGGGASTYAWNNGISNGVAFPANATTTYTVTGTAANGCTNTAQTTVTVNALPTVTAPANQTVCSGTNVTLNGGGASTYAWNNGITNGVAFPANATTTYTVTGTAANGCTNTAQTTVTVNALPTVTAPANQTVCSGTNVTLTGGGASTYAWNNGVSNGVAFPANATTTYTVTGTAANGCTNTAQTTVTVNALPTVTAPANQTVCSGTNVTLNGGGASTYAWNNGVTNGVAFPANATTTYTVTGTDANGCTNTAQTTVTVNALPTVTAPANQTVCSGTNVTLNGGGASTYAWNNGVSNGVAFPANATTTYTVTGTAANGCTNTAQTTVTVNALPTVTAPANQTVCSGTNVTLNGGGASTYAWNNGVSNGVAFPANATTTYTVTGTAANGCTNTAQTTVTVNALPTVTAPANQTVCSGTNVTLNGGGASTYAWNNGVSNGVAFPANATTTYTVTGTDANGCTNTAQTTVTVNALPTVTAPANQTVCSGTNVTLNGGGASTYAWNNGVSNGVAFPANATTTYTVTGTDANGCTNTAQTTVTINALPTVTAPANQTVCSGTSVTLSGSGAISYAWNNGVQDGVVFIPNATTTYTVIGTAANGCTNTAQTTVTVNALPAVNGGANQAICLGTAVTLSGSGASSYTWNNNIQNGVSFTPNATQTYTVTGIDNNGCSNVATVTVTVNSLPVVSANYPISVCQGTPVVLIASGALTYAWNNNVQNGIGFIPQSTQVYTVIGTDANGCTDSDQITVTVNSYPTVNAGSNQTVCAGSQVTLNASGAVSYTWNNNVVNGVPFTINSTQTFSVIGSNYGCNDTAQVTVTVNALPAVSAGANQSTCSGGSVTLTGSGAVSYTWNNNVQNGVAFIPNATATYTVTGTNANGCTNTAQTTVTVNALPTVNAGANQTVCTGSSATLNGSGAVSYAWNNNVQNGVSFVPNATQTYTVTGTDANGCQGTDQVLVTVASQTTSSITQTACLTYELNGQVYNQSGVYTQTLVNAQGCDSILTLNLTINGLPSIPVVNVGGDNQLSTPAVPNTTYQWVFCPSGLSISNQNDTSYLPNVNGSYAVEASNACGTVVSECVIIDNMGIEEVNNPLVIYPNPTINYLNIDGLGTEMISYEVIDVTGRVVLKGLVNQSNHGFEMGSLVTGNYTLRLHGVGSYSIIKQ